MQVLKQISASVQSPPSQAVTFTGSTDVATQTTLAAINTKLAGGTVIGDVNLGATDNAVLDNIDADLTTIIGHVDGLEGLIGTTNTNTGNSATSLAVMDDWDNGASDGASVSGDVAHDSADAGEPVKIGMKAYSPDGTTLAPQLQKTTELMRRVTLMDVCLSTPCTLGSGINT